VLRASAVEQRLSLKARSMLLHFQESVIRLTRAVPAAERVVKDCIPKLRRRVLEIPCEVYRELVGPSFVERFRNSIGALLMKVAGIHRLRNN
jgi:hypothetical protein